jgi:hypothetical protein
MGKDLEGSELGIIEIFYQNLSGGTERKRPKPQLGDLVSWLIFEHSTSRMQF